MTIAFTVILLGCAAGLVVIQVRWVEGGLPLPLEVRLALVSFFVGLCAAALGVAVTL